MSTETQVLVAPECDIHKHALEVGGVPAEFDGKTKHGPWAHMCGPCFTEHGVGLGTGRGQRLIVVDEVKTASHQ